MRLIGLLSNKPKNTYVMSIKMKIVKWSLISLASLIVFIVGFGYWFIGLIPKPVDQETLKALKRLGCDIAQGYFFSKPMPAEYWQEFHLLKRDVG